LKQSKTAFLVHTIPCFWLSTGHCNGSFCNWNLFASCLSVVRILHFSFLIPALVHFSKGFNHTSYPDMELFSAWRLSQFLAVGKDTNGEWPSFGEARTLLGERTWSLSSSTDSLRKLKTTDH
jgi:hypothetical protein